MFKCYLLREAIPDPLGAGPDLVGPEAYLIFENTL